MNFEQRIQQAKQEISSILAGEREGSHRTHLQAATYIAAASQSSSEAAKGEEPLSRKERARYNEKVKPQEEKSLIHWAKENNIWSEEIDFNKKYGENYLDEGAEQKVYLQKDGRRVNKVNAGYFHGTWLDFFNRLILHEAIFPSTAYKLIGFTEEQKQFCAVIEQPWVKVTRGATKEEVKAYLEQTGFINTKNNDYYNKNAGIILEDLHDENVLIDGNGNLVFVDPVIFLETPDLGFGGKSQFHFPFGKDFNDMK